MIDWLYKKERTAAILNKIGSMNDHFVAIDKEGLQPNYIIKMRSEQDKIRNSILVVFLLSYMLLLIKDLDNPFDYYNYGESGTKISLKPIRELEFAIKDLA